jgi:sulfur-oxidizing protein SoxX
MKFLAPLVVLLGLVSGAVWGAQQTPDPLAQGKAIAYDRRSGNCLACHAMDDGELPGNAAPPLLQMKLRFPDRAVLREQIWDATIRNPQSVMPPYGKHRILTEQQIDRVVDYIYTL